MQPSVFSGSVSTSRTLSSRSYRCFRRIEGCPTPGIPSPGPLRQPGEGPTAWRRHLSQNRPPATSRASDRRSSVRAQISLTENRGALEGENRGETDAARAALRELAQEHGDDVIGRLANLDLINLRIASGQGAEVATELEAMVAGRSNELPRDAALYRLGELYFEEGQPQKAKPHFEALVAEFPESPYLMNARQRLAEIG